MSTVERLGFKHLVAKVNPRYEHPSKGISQSELPNFYNRVWDSIVKLNLMQAKLFSATTHLWTSSAIVPFLLVVSGGCGHSVLPCFLCMGTTLGRTFSEAVTDVLAHWDLKPNQLIATTSDNGSNIGAVFRSLGWLCISCFGHNTDQAINKSLKLDQVSRSLARCHSLVGPFLSQLVKEP